MSSLVSFPRQSEIGSPSSSPLPSGRDVTVSVNTADDDIEYASSTSSIASPDQAPVVGSAAPPLALPSKGPARNRSRHRSNSTAIYADNGFVRPMIGDADDVVEPAPPSPQAAITTVFIGNLPAGTRARDVRKFVQTFGLVVKVFVPRQPDRHLPTVASVAFADPTAAAEAVDVLSHARAEGQRLLVRFADPEDPLDGFVTECAIHLRSLGGSIISSTDAVGVAGQVSAVPPPPAAVTVPAAAHHGSTRYPSPPATFEAVRRLAEERRGNNQRM